MKYAVLSYERKALSLNGRDGQNLGDWIQTLAVEELFREFGIAEYDFVSRNDAATYEGDEVRLLVNGYHTLINRVGYKTDTFPLSRRISPVFLSMHFHDRNIPLEMKNQLVKFGPIGCRDEETVLNMKEHGIPAFLSGCVTILFPRRMENPAKQKEILLVDAPDGLIAKMPENIRKQAKVMTQIFSITRQSETMYMTEEESVLAYDTAKRLLEYYRENARLVVTSRLHAAVPCMAMGIPVILAKEDFDGRFSWVDKYLPLYSKDKWEEIDWNPVSVELEEDKRKLKACYKECIFSESEKRKDVECSIFDERERYPYNKYVKIGVEHIKEMCGEYEQYVLWGVTDNTLRLNNIVRELCPNWKLTSVYDKIVEGQFEGLKIDSIEELKLEKEKIYFVVAPKAWGHAEKLLRGAGCRYVLVDFNDAHWMVSL